MEKLTKRQRKHLRELSGRAYEAELSNRMGVLFSQFKDWNEGKISVWELSDLIHEFHDGDSRDMYKFYEYSKNYEYQVARAIRNGYLSMEDVEESCRGYVEYWIESRFKDGDED